MPLFGGQRDISLFSHFNREILERIVEVKVDIFKQIGGTSNLYGESTEKTWSTPVRVDCMIGTEEQGQDGKEFGPDVKQIAKFYFLRDILVEKNIFTEVGDVIHWNEQFWEIDNIIANKFHMKRVPETNKTIGDDWGWDVSVQCITHRMRKNLPQLIQVRAGDDE